jgi:hypothetical protein
MDNNTFTLSELKVLDEVINRAYIVAVETCGATPALTNMQRKLEALIAAADTETREVRS